jgi:hypothetical protein
VVVVIPSTMLQFVSYTFPEKKRINVPVKGRRVGRLTVVDTVL